MLHLPLGPAVLNLRKDYRPGNGMECRTLDVVSAGGRVWGCLRQTTDDPAEDSDAWMLFFDIDAVVPKKYDLCEFYYFRHPTLKPGMQPAQGGLLENAAELYPDAWEYLQTEEGQKLCKTEAEWQALTSAFWATLADGTKIGWNGIGGAPFYAPNYATGALRLPDLRGMYAEAAGFDSLGVGDVHGDGIRKLFGTVTTSGHGGVSGMSYGGANGGGGGGAFYPSGSGRAPSCPDHGVYNASSYIMDSSRVVPTANKVQGRAWGALACVYLGLPAS